MPVLYVESDGPGAGKTALAATLAALLREEGRASALLKPLRAGVERGGDGVAPEMEAFRLATGGTGAVEEPVALSAGEADASIPGETLGRLEELAGDAAPALVEGPGSLDPDDPVGRASGRMAEAASARVLAVLGYRGGMDATGALRARELFGDRLLGVVVNGVTRYRQREATEEVLPAIERAGARALGWIPEDRTLLGASVAEIARHLGGRFLAWEEHADRLVEHFMIGARVMDWAVLYFQQHSEKAVVARADRPDVIMAALRTGLAGLVLAGGVEPVQYARHEAEEEEVPTVLVEGGVQETAGALESLGERARFAHSRKMERFRELLLAGVDTGVVRRAL